MRDDDKREVVILHRYRDRSDAGLHSGVWKIAYADFMTAMMAFFLVMWLISATNNEAKTAIASYFNPVKLAEMTDNRRGLGDPSDRTGGGAVRADAGGNDVGEGAAQPKGTAPVGAGGPTVSEQALFQDPYAVLAELAAKSDAKARRPDAALDPTLPDSGRTGLSDGDTFRDPFDPVYWQTARAPLAGNASGTGKLGAEQRPDAAAPLSGGGEEATDAAMQAATVPAPTAEASGADALSPAAGVPAPSAPMTAPLVVPPPQVAAADAHEAALHAPPEHAYLEAPRPVSPEQVAGDTALARVVSDALGPKGSAGPGVDVREVAGGTLIRMMDAADYEMFAVGSAEPQPDLVNAMARIGAALKDRPGRIVIAGYTDGRPFRSDTYDNWRLSSARAQMAYYMLVRGGLDGARVDRIEGHGDHDLRRPDDPLAAENRRIEILIRKEGT